MALMSSDNVLEAVFHKSFYSIRSYIASYLLITHFRQRQAYNTNCILTEKSIFNSQYTIPKDRQRPAFCEIHKEIHKEIHVNIYKFWNMKSHSTRFNRIFSISSVYVVTRDFWFVIEVVITATIETQIDLENDRLSLWNTG